MQAMNYVSTRSQANSTATFEDVLLGGLARDGGLYVPDSIPQMSAGDIAALAGLSYEEQAFRVMRPFIGDAFTDDEFEAIIHDKRPEFSARRALRMFKIALEKGTGNSTAIERPSFVLTCKQFGMGQLVDTHALDDADRAQLLASRSKSRAGSRMQSRGSLSSALHRARVVPL